MFSAFSFERVTHNLGTPHRGSTLARVGFSIANVVNALSPLRLETTRELLRTLQFDSEMLREVHLDFIWRCNKIQITSFYETRMTKVGPLKRTVSTPELSAW